MGDVLAVASSQTNVEANHVLGVAPDTLSLRLSMGIAKTEQYALADIPLFSPNQHAAFQRGGYMTILDLFLSMPQDVARKCRITIREVNEMLDTASKAIAVPPQRLADIPNVPSCFTSGDATLDKILGGGVRTGMVWEIVGEGASGKTQLALQLSICVQLPVAHHGLDGSACYLRTYSNLPTSRLVEIAEENSVLANLQRNALENVITLETKSPEFLMTVLTVRIPALLEDKSRPPVKLLVIDAIAELFHEEGKTTTVQLSERSRSLGEISSRLHLMAARYNIAVVVLNHVVDVFEYTAAPGAAGELIYAEQAKLFSSGNSIAAEQRKKAALGLVWANQVNARIMLTRTNRRRMVEGAGARRKRTPGVDSSDSRDSAAADEDVLIRRLSLLFSSVSPPSSVDFVVTQRGVECLAEELYTFDQPIAPISSRIAGAQPAETSLRNVEPLDTTVPLNPSDEPEPQEVDDEELYWRGVDDLDPSALPV